MSRRQKQHSSQHSTRQASGPRRRHVFWRLGYFAWRMGCRPAARALASFLEGRTQSAVKFQYVQVGYGGRCWDRGRYVARPRGLAEEIDCTRAYTMEAMRELEQKGLIHVDGETVTVTAGDRSWTQRKGSRDSNGGHGLANRYRPGANLVRLQAGQEPRPAGEESTTPKDEAAPGGSPTPQWDETDEWLLKRIAQRKQTASTVPEPDP